MISYLKFCGYEGFAYHENFQLSANNNLLAENILKHVWSPCIWREGKRKRENFLYADFAALDFDQPNEITMDAMIKNLCDHKLIIATTKSHQKEKKGIVCDRYRLIMPFERRISDLAEYEYNMQTLYKQYDWADKSCLDAARFFYPSKKIEFINRDKDAYLCAVVGKVGAPAQEIIMCASDKIPSWALNFINDGYLGKTGSRNMMLFTVSLELFKCGYEKKSVRSLVQRAPIDWQGVNILSIIDSANKKYLTLCGGGTCLKG